MPQTFLWGVSTAGHQNEGDNVNSDTWFLEHTVPSAFAEPSGQACDGYRRWQSDLDLVASLGLTAYRFSVEWSRVEPARGEVDDEALAHYEAVVDGCLTRGLAPIITFSHFTAPHWFACAGSWLAAGAAEDFGRFCGRVMDCFGDRIALAMTLNEPDLPRMLQAMDLPEETWEVNRVALAAASRRAGVERYRSGNVVLPEEMDALRDGLMAGHRAAKAAIKARRPDLPVGFALAMTDDVAIPGGEARRDGQRAQVYDDWLALASDDDFIGVQNYEQLVYGPDGLVPPPAGEALNDMGTPVRPESLANAVRYAYSKAGVPILVSEHGLCTHDDSLRAGFIAPAVAGLQQAMADGIPVLGYCHWTLMDNFEWVFGYGKQFGLYEVDRQTFARTAKPSAAAYRDLVAANRG